MVTARPVGHELSTAEATPVRVGRGENYHHNEETAHREVDLTARKLENKPKIDLKTLLELGQNISIISYIGFNMVTHTRYVAQQDCKG